MADQATDSGAAKQGEEPAPERLGALTGFDVEGAMARVVGNHKLYKKLLTNFIAKNTESTSLIEDLLENGKFKAAAEKLHTVKGVAGNLGATALFEATRDLEGMVKHDGATFDDRTQLGLAKYIKTLDATVAIVERAMRDAAEEPTGGTAPCESNALPAGKKIQLAERLLDACQSGDVSQLEKLVGSLTDGLMEKEQLSELVENFDLEGAEALARAWTSGKF